MKKLLSVFTAFLVAAFMIACSDNTSAPKNDNNSTEVNATENNATN